MLELGAIFLRTETELILKSRRVVPQRLLEAGFKFNFADWRLPPAIWCTVGVRIIPAHEAKLPGRKRRLLWTLTLFAARCLVNNLPRNPLAMERRIAQHGL